MSPALPPWATLVRAPNPGPMTLEGTNTWLLAARGGVVVVDPGPLHEQHLAEVAARGRVLLTVLTHGHADHAAGARRFAALTGSPVVAADPALCLGADPLRPGREDPQELDLAGLSLTVLSTPGHTADSVVLLARAGGTVAALTGDTVLGRGTTVVAHPDGRLHDYLGSLARLVTHGERERGLLVLPGHGPVLPDLADAARAYLAHRHDRLAQVRAALAAGAGDPAQVLDAVYPGLDPALRPAAGRTVAAALDYLRELSASGG